MSERAASLADFVAAQDLVWPAVVQELSDGAKRSHWMWFVFPQLVGIGRSGTARFFGIRDAAAARSYLDDPTLGARLRTCVGLMMRHAGRPPESILGAIDAVKFRACLTLFEAVAPDEPAFAAALESFYAGERDAQTLALLDR